MKRLAAALALALLLSPAHAAEFKAGAPEAHSFDPAALAALLAGARESGLPIHSLTIVRGGDVVLDAGFYPYDPATLHDMASVTKSVMTSLVGIAAGEGKLDLDAPMLSFFPGRAVANRDARKESITVRDLTQNVSGLACIGAPDETTLSAMEASADFVQFTLDLPMANEPGSHFDYCSPGMHLLSAILQQATGMTAFDYAKSRLFGPLGITDVAWDSDAQGFTRGWGDLHLTPEGMVRLGLMWLHGGQWEGRQIIPAAWLKVASTEGRTSDRYEPYGSGFWIGPADKEPIPYFMASGRGGQRILMVPVLDLVITVTAGGIEAGDVVEAVVGTVKDWGAALPPDAAGEEALRSAIAAVAAPPEADSPAPLPAMAAAVNGKVFTFPANPYEVESVSMEFTAEGEAWFTLVAGGETSRRPIGLDGRYRWSDGPDGIRFGDRGGWIDETTLIIDHNTIGDIRAYTLTARFAGDSVELTIDQRDEPMTVTLTGTAQ